MKNILFKKKARFTATLLFTVFTSIQDSQAADVHCPDPSNIQWASPNNSPICAYTGTTTGAQTVALKGFVGGAYGCPDPKSFHFHSVQENNPAGGFGCGYVSSSTRGSIKFFSTDKNAFNGCSIDFQKNVFDCNTTSRSKSRQPRR